MPYRNWCFFGPTYPSPMSRGSYVPGLTSSSQRSTALSLPSPGETDLAHLGALAACRRRDGHPSSCLLPEAPTCCGQAMWRLGADSCRVTAALARETGIVFSPQEPHLCNQGDGAVIGGWVTRNPHWSPILMLQGVNPLFPVGTESGASSARYPLEFVILRGMFKGRRAHKCLDEAELSDTPGCLPSLSWCQRELWNVSTASPCHSLLFSTLPLRRLPLFLPRLPSLT